jgi:hypothetical protein
MNIIKYGKAIAAALRNERYKLSDGGVLLFNDSLRLQGVGEYLEGVNGRDWRVHRNLLVDQGLIFDLNVTFGNLAKITTWYLAPFSGAATPANTWTAANFTANASEIVSGTEGYAETTRVAVAFVNAAAATQIDNYAAKSVFTIVTASSLSVTGIGLLSLSTKGGTTGTLMSATKFGTTRVLQNADVWNVGYRVVLASS